MRTILILTFIFCFSSCKAQSGPDKKIIGKWVLVAEKDPFDNDMERLEEGASDSGSEGELKTTLTFNKDRSIFINQMGNEYNATYELTDSILTLGDREYTLLEIDEKKMVYKDNDDLFVRQYEYKRVE